MTMRKVTFDLAKSAGFCFGVDRAVRICETLIGGGKRIATLGPIIHNRQAVEALAARGAAIIGSPAEADRDMTVVIRSHGVEQAVFEELRRRGVPYADATCPFVKKIHDIVRAGVKEGRAVLVAGDRAHPEVAAICSYCEGKAVVFDSPEELSEIIFPKTGDIPAIMVAQTTFHLVQYKKCVEKAEALFSDIKIYDTVCNATAERQREARRLGMDHDVCIVIGGHNSSNTRKLFDVCGEHAVTYLIESADALLDSMLKGAKTIGVTAGASTPAPVIEEVLTRMSDMIREDGTIGEEDIVEEQQAVLEHAEPQAMPEEDGDATDEFDFEKALEDSLRPIHRNQRVVGTVTQVRPNEVVVDIGSKHTGIIPAEEMSDDSSAKIEELIKVGDKLTLLVIQTNDQEGITTLSKKRVDSAEGLDVLMAAAEEGTVLDAYVTELVNKGLVAVVKGVRVFVPASQATVRRGENYDHLLRTNIKMRILEVNPARRRAIGSIRAVLQEELNVKRDAFWETVEEGKVYSGIVKSLTSYGAFVDLGGVDGMVHISELSWQRVRNPSDILSVGQEVEVYVREVDRVSQRISLGYRKEDDNPWKMLENVHAVGDIFTAPVVSLTKFGAFVRIMPGIDGLVHVSEISEEHVEKASDILSVGDEVTVKLIGVDYDRRRVSLSMKFEGAPLLVRKPRRERNQEEAKAPEAEQPETLESAEMPEQPEMTEAAEPAGESREDGAAE